MDSDYDGDGFRHSQNPAAGLRPSAMQAVPGRDAGRHRGHRDSPVEGPPTGTQDGSGGTGRPEAGLPGSGVRNTVTVPGTAGGMRAAAAAAAAKACAAMPALWLSLLSPFLLTAMAAGAAHAQGGVVGEHTVSPADQAVILAGFAVATIAVFVYIARHSIMRRRTLYDDRHDLGSKEDRDREKYSSDWADGYEEVGSRTRRKSRGDDGGASGPPDPYMVMGVGRDATRADIKARYRILARQNHPDKSDRGDARERMAGINKAYEILSDPQKRDEYDRSCQS